MNNKEDETIIIIYLLLYMIIIHIVLHDYIIDCLGMFTLCKCFIVFMNVKI